MGAEVIACAAHGPFLVLYLGAHSAQHAVTIQGRSAADIALGERVVQAIREEDSKTVEALLAAGADQKVVRAYFEKRGTASCNRRLPPAESSSELLFWNHVFTFPVVLAMIKGGFFLTENDVEQITARFLASGVMGVLDERKKQVEAYKESIQPAISPSVLIDLVVSYVMTYKNPPPPKFTKNEKGKWVQKKMDIDELNWG